MGTILRHIQPSVDFAKVIDRHYVRLVEPGSVLGLSAEPFLKDPVIREVRGAAPSVRRSGRWLCLGLATPRPCRHGPATRSGDNARTACPPPAHHTQPAASPTGKSATAVATSGRSSTPPAYDRRKYDDPRRRPHPMQRLKRGQLRFRRFESCRGHHLTSTDTSPCEIRATRRDSDLDWSGHCPVIITDR